MARLSDDQLDLFPGMTPPPATLEVRPWRAALSTKGRMVRTVAIPRELREAIGAALAPGRPSD